MVTVMMVSKQTEVASTPSSSPLLLPSSSGEQIRSMALVILAGAVTRLALFSTSLPTALETRPELSTPLSSIQALREAAFLRDHTSADPYSAGHVHQSPLLLALFARHSPLDIENGTATAMLWTAADLVGALALASLCARRERGSAKPKGASRASWVAAM